MQKQYVKKLTQEDKDEVINIYHDDEVSYSLPDIKYANLRFMHFTLREAYAVYVRKCQHQRIVAEKSFEGLKPKNVRTVQETPLRGARCEYCAKLWKNERRINCFRNEGNSLKPCRGDRSHLVSVQNRALRNYITLEQGQNYIMF